MDREIFHISNDLVGGNRVEHGLQLVATAGQNKVGTTLSAMTLLSSTGRTRIKGSIARGFAMGIGM
ncbi:unnamed protein product [Prunus armeniaca]|uniref:Uncharacterized protein n=1 Tax=Prunus armeniaca TaxID=36596 RepID=A0A6J5WT98_PRUAR|nr:unnamed protein product [Prunus armeniaca]